MLSSATRLFKHCNVVQGLSSSLLLIRGGHQYPPELHLPSPTLGPANMQLSRGSAAWSVCSPMSLSQPCIALLPCQSQAMRLGWPAMHANVARSRLMQCPASSIDDPGAGQKRAASGTPKKPSKARTEKAAARNAARAARLSGAEPQFTVSKPDGSLETSDDVQDYWREVLDTIEKSNLADMKALMNVKHPIGVTLDQCKERKAQIMCYDLFLQYKKMHPKAIVLMQLGDFYETLGMDALVMIQHLGFRPTAADRGIPKAGAPKQQLSKVVAELNMKNFTVAVVTEHATPLDKPSSSNRIKHRYLQGVSTPAKPMYIPVSTNSMADTSNQLFAAQRPIVGIAQSQSGFIAHVLYLDLRKIEKTEAMTWDAVLSLLRAKGASTLLLHNSLDNMKRQTCRAALTRMGREEIGHYLNYSGDYTQGFMNEVKQLMFLDPQETEASQGNQLDFEVVTNHDYEADRPQPLPRSTVTQLGLEGDMGIRSLLSAVLPSGSVLCVEWMRQLLLLPPPPDMALHIQGIVAHLSDSDAPLSGSINTDLPSGKVAEVVSSHQGDAPFFRELHGMVKAVLEMLDNPHHLKMWQHVLPYVMWMNKRMSEDMSVFQFTEQLREAVHLIADIVALDEAALLRERRSASRSSLDGEKSIDEDGDPSRDTEEVRMFWEDNEGFRMSINDHKLTEHLEKVNRTQAALRAEVAGYWVRLRDRAGQGGTGRQRAGGLSQVVVRNVDGAFLVVQVPLKASLSDQAIRALDSSSINLKEYENVKVPAGGPCWMNKKIQERLPEYRDACKAAHTEATRLLRQLCDDLMPFLPDLLLACHCSIVVKALASHTQGGIRAAWSLPDLVVSPRLQPPPGPGGPRPDCPPLKMSLQGYWPYWMDRDGPTVPNDLQLDRLVLLTGPNMAGKSTVLRSVCAVALLANCGLMVPANRAVVPFYDAYLLRNFSGDSPVERMSSFAMEMHEVSVANNQCTSRSLVLLDEMSKGTEVAKGTALAGAVIVEWCERGFTGIFATHLHGLVPITKHYQLEERGQLAYKCMGLTEGDEYGRGRQGTWKLQDGYCFESLAFEVARQQDMNERVLSRAEVIMRGIEEGRFPLHGAGLMQGGDEGKQPHRLAPPYEDHDPSMDQELSDEPADPRSVVVESEAETPAKAVISIPQRTLEEAMEVLQATVRERFGDGEKLVFQTVGPGQMPSPKHVAQGAVYVTQWFGSGMFYSGQTKDIAARLKEHRRNPIPTSPNSSMRHRGPKTSMVYALMPDGHPGVEEELEPLIITALQEAGFPLTSTHDKTRKRKTRERAKKGPSSPSDAEE